MKTISVNLILIFLFSLMSINSWADKVKIVGENNQKSAKAVTAGCTPATASTELDLNNVRALIHTGGDMWWDLQGSAKYEVPVGSGKTALFAGSIWIGGVDVNGQLKIAAQRFRQDGIDYWPGPLKTEAAGPAQATVTPDICRKFDRHFVITRNEVAMFRAWYNTPTDQQAELFPGYSVPKIIKEWPANGDVENGYSADLAPYFDNNDDGYYNYLDGDYPFYDLDGQISCGTDRRIGRLYGDKTLWWVYNDKGNIHTETGGDAIGMELKAQAFAFSTNDELNNMTFYNYNIINRSTYTLKNTYFGVWTDADLGDATDDYVGCDVNRGLGYLYNGDADDGNNGSPAWAYGLNPPAIGVDFFEGPYQDPDGKDNLSNWTSNGVLDCFNGYRLNSSSGVKEIAGPSDILNGNINGLNFGDGVVDNERWGMRRFIYFNNASGPTATQDPKSAADHYNYLLGLWKDGSKLLFGGTGYASGATTTTQTDFMFPGKTDKCNWGTSLVDMSSYGGTTGWTEKFENNQAGDRRFVQSAGPFVLQPGASNDITTGVVWARTLNGDNFASVVEVQKADDKAQRLFEVCFKVLDGPDAPEMEIIEMDQRIIVHLWNKTNSNNYLEAYDAKDPFTVCPFVNGVESSCDKNFKFQGYQVYQLKDKSASIADIYDATKARLVFQCDIKDGIGQLVNYYWDDEMQANVPRLEVQGQDNGIKHSFVLTEDAFAKGDRRLVNHKKYYFIAIAYAHNNFKKYDQNNQQALDGQKTPYKAGRKGADGSIKTYEVIPHKTDNTNGGTIMNSNFGDEPAITMHDGYGCATNEIDLEQETIDQIMAGAPWKATSLKYKAGKGPIKVKVVDPLNVPSGEYVIKMIPDSVRKKKSGYYYINTYFMPDTLNYDINSYILDAKWAITDKPGVTNAEPIGTIYSDSWISLNNEQLIPSLGLSVVIEQSTYPFPAVSYVNQPEKAKVNPDNNGFITSSIEYSDPTKPWLYFMSDQDASHTYMDWIRSGTDYTDPASDDCNWYFNDRKISGSTWMDAEQIYENVVEGGWAPYRLVSTHIHGPGDASSISQMKTQEQRLANVDIVITSDTTKWTRAVILETTDNKYKLDADGCVVQEANVANTASEGGAKKLNIRLSPSVGKNGLPDNSGTRGMGWFPGYAIDIETGERLNIMFGESSRLMGENGRDMKWNPTGRYATDLYTPSLETLSPIGEPLMGGKHFIYIMGHNVKYNTSQKKYQDAMKMYDNGDTIRVMLDSLVPQSTNKRNVFMNCMWVGVPLHNTNFPFMATDVKIKLRVISPYRKRVHTIAYGPDSLSPNKGFPMYSFSTANLATTKNDATTLKNALDLINVVPNPYYAHNAYELTQIDNLVKFTNLPQKCTISIYSVNGTLIRRYDKDSPLTYLDWDLKNSHGISISGGVYVIHINVPEVGDKILKWFGALRPIDLNAF